MTDKPKRIRRRRPDLQLQIALDQASEAIELGVDPATKGLIQTRLTILDKQLTRERNEKFKRLQEELTAVKAENEKLKTELTEKLANPPAGSRLPNLDEQVQEMLRQLQTDK
jgi:hypothetical protein